VKKLMTKVRALFTRRDDGASAVEYGLLVALIAVAIASSVVLLANALENRFGAAQNCVQNSVCP